MDSASQLPSADETPYKVETVGTLITQPDPLWLVDGILQQGTLTLVLGAPGCGKSFLVQDLAFNLALGRDWFGHSHDAETRTGVLYIAAEAGGGTVTRAKAFCIYNDLDGADLAPESCPIHFIRAPVDLLDPETVSAIELTWEAFANRFEVIVFDTLSRCMPGGNENSPEDMTKAINTLDLIRHWTDATIIVVHHTPIAEKDRPRGHSSLLAAADTAIKVEKLGEARRATVTYQRDGEEGMQLTFRLSPIETGLDHHGRLVTSCVVELSNSVDAKAARSMSGYQSEAYDALVELAKEVEVQRADTETVSHRGLVGGKFTPVPVKLWRKEFDRRISKGQDMNREASRKAFCRAKKSLQEMEIVEVADEHAWIIPDTRN